MTPRLALIVPVYNEAGNILPLVEEIRAARKTHGFPHTLILIDNGSRDGSAAELARAKGEDAWVQVHTLTENRGYGGGVSFGFQLCGDDVSHLGWIPADGQYRISDVATVWQRTLAEPRALHKGRRVVRHDPKQMQFVSAVYTRLVNALLPLRTADANALPKIFPRELWSDFNFQVAPNFLFDCQILASAALLGMPIREHSVEFIARRHGVSSWSNKKIRTYSETIWGLIRLRTQAKKKKKAKGKLHAHSGAPGNLENPRGEEFARGRAGGL